VNRITAILLFLSQTVAENYFSALVRDVYTSCFVVLLASDLPEAASSVVV